MKPTKKLVLKKETLAELTTDELQSVVAGAATGPSGCHRCPTLPVEDCLSPVIADTIGCSLNLGCWTDDCVTQNYTCICR